MAYEQTAQNHPSKHEQGETALTHSSLHKSLLELKPLTRVHLEYTGRPTSNKGNLAKCQKGAVQILEHFFLLEERH